VFSTAPAKLIFGHGTPKQPSAIKRALIFEILAPENCLSITEMITSVLRGEYSYTVKPSTQKG
jgi:hypothetical protein